MLIFSCIIGSVGGDGAGGRLPITLEE